MEIALEIPEDALRRRRTGKWRDYPADVLPAWIAEMDYAAAPAVRDALMALVEREDYGYGRRDGGQPVDSLAAAFARWARRAYHWEIDPAQVLAVTDLTQAKTACLVAYTKPGDVVLVNTPCYPPFREVVHTNGRVVSTYPWAEDRQGYVLDTDALRRAILPGSKLLLLCHPHNPTGRLLRREELAAIGEIAEEHGLIVVSDEVHADLVYEGHEYVPYASASPVCARHTVTITSAAKSFNIPGLRCGVMHFSSPDLLARFLAAVPRRLLGQPGIAGIDATVAAWTHGDEWLAAVRAHLQAGREWLTQAVQAIPGLAWHPPQASYFGWIDCAGRLGARHAGQYFLEHARVAFSAGDAFDPAAGSYIRFNFATSIELRQRIWARVVDSLPKDKS